MSQAALLLMVLFCVNAVAAAPSATPFVRPNYLPKLMDLAEQNSPVIQKARRLLEIADNENRNAFWRFFPSLNLEARHGLVAQDPDTRTTPWASELALSLNHVLYDVDNNVTLDRLNISRKKFERAKLEFMYARDEQLMKVAQAYYDWSTSLELREIEENKRDLLRRQYNILNSQYRQGLKTKRDVLRIETEIRRLEISILQRQNEVDLNYNKLAAAVGLAKAELDAQEIEGEQAKPFAAVQAKPPELLVEDHRRAQILKLQEAEAWFETGLAKNNYYPRLTLESEVKYLNKDYVDRRDNQPFLETDTWNWQSMLVLRYNIWDFGQRRRDLQISRLKARTVEDTNRQSLLDLSAELRDVYLKLNEFRENVSAARELLVLEQQSYSVLEGEYRNGRASYLDLITNLNSLIDARSKFMTSYFGYKKQQVVYSFHKGNLYDEIKKP